MRRGTRRPRTAWAFRATTDVAPTTHRSVRARGERTSGLRHREGGGCGAPPGHAAHVSAGSKFLRRVCTAVGVSCYPPAHIGRGGRRGAGGAGRGARGEVRAGGVRGGRRGRRCWMRAGHAAHVSAGRNFLRRVCTAVGVSCYPSAQTGRGGSRPAAPPRRAPQSAGGGTTVKASRRAAPAPWITRMPAS
jgi:hypothetical protein